ncbi:hypothetical protein ACFSCZ_06320 [Siminovitchia sediminis]|uniref:Uncharacterized protein n=1 Tax=Siminovitchia sediminis TaxID=1274353 RepID=A0ABW4KFU8_9BACI
MRRNRLLIYLFLFMAMVAAYTVYSGSNKDEFPQDQTIRYQSSMRAAAIDMIKFIKIEDIQKEHKMSKDRIASLAAGSEELLSNYTELNTIASAYLGTDHDSGDVFEYMYLFFHNLSDLDESTVSLRENQVIYIEEIHHFLTEMVQTGLFEMELKKSLEEIEKLILSHPNLSQWVV